MGDFSGVENVKPSADRLQLLQVDPTVGSQATYLLEVTVNKILTTQTGRALLREFKVLESEGQGATPAGREAKAKLLYLSDAYVMTRIVEYVRGLTGQTQVDAATCDAIFGDKNPLAGKKIKVIISRELSAGDPKKKKDPAPYDKYTWRYVDETEKKAKK